MFQGFYITTEDCIGEATYPGGWSGPVGENTPVVMVYFDEQGMEFMASVYLDSPVTFRLQKPCPVVAACSCPHCGKIVPTVTIKMHIETDENCRRIWEMKHEKEDVSKK